MRTRQGLSAPVYDFALVNKDGMSLYAGYFAPNGLDPWGLADVGNTEPQIPDNIPDEERDEWLFKQQRQKAFEQGPKNVEKLQEALLEASVEAAMNVAGLAAAKKAAEAVAAANNARKAAELEKLKNLSGKVDQCLAKRVVTFPGSSLFGVGT
jgi:hypothetical protein